MALSDEGSHGTLLSGSMIGGRGARLDPPMMTLEILGEMDGPMIKPPGKPGIAIYLSSKTTKRDAYVGD